MDNRKPKIFAIGLAFAAATSVLAAHGEARGDPILDYSGGVGNPNLAVPRVHVDLGPTPALPGAKLIDEYQPGIVKPGDEGAILNNTGGVSVQHAIAPGLPVDASNTFLVRQAAALLLPWPAD